MQECLKNICTEFEKLKGFLNGATSEQEQLVNTLFEKFMDCFEHLKAEKLEYPKEFINDVRLYNEGFEPIYKKFADIQIRYLMLSDFYDFARLTKRYIKE
ncbi:hypothetical protein [Candidatus Marinarcus aquaticus]|uniref:Uncharacterized protein n=1 Tax=Candidatus Marinarcus aquaticus TaxID=2044504 RepID=A0A4Q0XSQ0_9BACT|nr:hypothetical protein [Candidatus Marinarcus aquaticus]RXJ60043.1 hypothetical protein CRV04_03255 [Candidatus Marinarcus aquaticus]